MATREQAREAKLRLAELFSVARNVGPVGIAVTPQQLQRVKM